MKEKHFLGDVMNLACRIIKKYPNRRLYDTETRCYITLEDVKKIVLMHIPFQVIDVKTDQDVTQAILLQIIHDQENENSPIFTREILQNLIRFYGHPLQKQMSQLMEQCFHFFMNPTPEKGSEDFQAHIHQWLKNQGAGLEAAVELAKYNMTTWQSVFKPGFESEKDPQKKK